MSENYEFIDGCKYAYPIVAMCQWLGVSRSGFYKWRDRSSATAERRAALTELITEIFNDSDETYGYRRIHAELGRRGVEAGQETGADADARRGPGGLPAAPVAPQPHPGRRQPSIPDLVARDFTADAPGRKFVGDITYIPTWEGWLYLATFIDGHTKAVIGYAMDDHYKTR